MTEKMYTAISFAPVQGFIEKSRKLRDLIGASQILSYLSAYIIAHTDGYTVISPAPIKTSRDEPEKGLPNLIIIKGDRAFPEPDKILLEGWRKLLTICRNYIETNLPDYNWKYHGWDEAWINWGNHTWEIFVASDGDRQKALDQLEAQKLQRAWIAINWTGESSSLSGQDAICHPRMGLSPDQNEIAYIEKFYENLAKSTSKDRQDDTDNEDSINKFINTNERLSLPELVKRLATRDDIIDELGGLMPNLEKGFRDIIRTPQPPKGTPTPPYRQWTGWFMGDGDGIGDHLKTLKSDKEITQFSETMRSWGKDFAEGFELGRMIYAGGDDFFGVIYDRKFNGYKESCITGTTIIDWLIGLKQQWNSTGKKPVSFSMGFVWAAPSVPQRDILQHCREAEKLAKSKGKDRVTIRVVFNSGQYVQWTCPWDLLGILKSYGDRDGQQNWGHIYNDLAQLEARHAFCLQSRNRDGFDPNDINDSSRNLEKFMSIYFPQYINQNEDSMTYEEILKTYRAKLFPYTATPKDISWEHIQFCRDLINVGFQLSS